MPETRIENNLKFISDELLPGDVIYVPVALNKNGLNVLKGSFKRKDPWSNKKHDTFRVAVPTPKRYLPLEIGEIWCGTVKEIVPTGRSIFCPREYEVVEVKLRNMQASPTTKSFSYFRHDGCIVEGEVIMIAGAWITTIYRDFNVDNVPSELITMLPKLDLDDRFVLIKQNDKYLGRPSMDQEKLALLLQQIKEKN